MQCNILCTFPEVAIVRYSSKNLFLKYGRQIRAEFLEMLEASIFFRGLPMSIAIFLRQFCRRIQIYPFFVVRFNIYCPKNSQ